MILSPQRPYDVAPACLQRILRDGLCSKGNSWNLWESILSSAQHGTCHCADCLICSRYWLLSVCLSQASLRKETSPLTQQK